MPGNAMASAPQATAAIRLHHGTDIGSANDLLKHGLDPARAAVYNATGEFWATSDHAFAEVFAQVNPAGGPPACFEFDLAEAVMQWLLGRVPRVVYQHDSDTFEVLPGSFSDVNLHMTNPQIVPVP
jgi:hypothetical protein